MPLLFLALVALIFNPLTSHAQVGDTAVQAQCFDTLKGNLLEATLFEEPLLVLADLTYEDVQRQFSEKKSTLQSFFITVDEPILSTRIASFGRQTGYTHPPKSIFPSYLESETWGGPVKEYVIGEEYVTDPNGVEHFVDCFFLQIEADDFMAVTEDRYAYDGTGIALLKTAPNLNYKATFEESPSFDYDNVPFATWTRVFVYPEAANNPYFNKYQVIEAFPANKVTSFAPLSFFNEIYTKVEDFEVDTGATVHKYFKTSASGTVPVEIAVDPVLQPVVPAGVDMVYRTAKYFQAIINTFPAFAEKLSIQGSLKYETFIDIITRPSLDSETEKFMTAFGNGDNFGTYYFDKNSTGQEIPEFERVIPLVQNGDWTIAQIEAGAKFDDLVYQEGGVGMEAPQEVAPTNQSSVKVVLALIVATSLLLIGLIVLHLRKKHKLVSENLV